MINGIEETLARLGVRPSKGRGQNFLASVDALSLVLEFAAVRSDEVVIEIGPGLGVMTPDLLISARRYIGIEIEERFARHLRRTVANIQPEQILQGDVRNLSIEQIVSAGGAGEIPAGGVTIVSNLPYSISTDVVEWIIRQRTLICRASLLLQREFAERIAAEPGSRAFGSLSVFCQVYAACTLGPVITGDSFHPSAEVESRLVELRVRKEPLVSGDNEKFFKFVRSAFAAKRKTLLNNLTAAGWYSSKSEGEVRLRALDIEPSRRAEALTIAEFVRIFKSLE